jgi:zinc resistance-associated protein
MKKLAVIIGIVFLVGAVAYPVLAHGPGWGKGGHSYGRWGGGPGYCYQGQGNFGNLTDEQRAKLDKLNQDFYNETNTLRNEIWTKKRELNTLLSQEQIDEEKVRALNKDLTALKAEMADKRLQHRLDAQKIAPGAGFGPGWGRKGHHKGFGPSRGYGGPMGGYGQGGCWN